MTKFLKHLPITQISPNPYQPRTNFKKEELEELAQSILENGLMQPIIVRPSDIIGYELIAGERRLRASQLAGLSEIPALIEQKTDQESLQLAMVENLQRENLNPMEEARSYQFFLDKTGLTHDELAKKMGKSRPYISNSLRLLHLPENLQKALENGELSSGHARLLLSLKDARQQEHWLQRIKTEKLSVRQLEDLINRSNPKKNKTKSKDPFLKETEERLKKSLGLSVTLNITQQNKGSLHITFSDLEELNNLINRLI